MDTFLPADLASEGLPPARDPLGIQVPTGPLPEDLALQRRLLAILAERSTMTVTAISRRWLRRDWWLDAEDAVSLGFADEAR